jgi:heme oxygenase
LNLEPHQPVVSALRRATADRHRSIESLLSLDAAPDRRRYARMLQGFGLFLAAWEPQVRAALPRADAAWFTARSRRHLLEHDLQVLRIASPRPLAALPGFRLADVAGAWGSMYVLEGSALGGQVIARQLAQQLAIGPETGGAYFHGWGGETGVMWRHFRERLERELAGDDAALARACAAAVATFDALAGAFTMVLDEPVAA